MMPAGRGGTLGRTCAGPQPGPVMAAGTAVWSGPAVPGASLPRPAVPELPCPGPAWQRIDGKDSQGLQGRGRAKARGFGGGGEAVSHGRTVCILPPARRRRAEAVRHDCRVLAGELGEEKICRQKAMPFQWLECLSLAMSPMRVQALQNMWLPLFLCLSKLDTRQLHGYLFTSWPASAPTQARMLLLASAAHFSGVFLHTLPCFRADPAGQDCCP